VTRRQEWSALAALVLVSTGLRAWAAVSVPVPWIAPDEMVYGLLGRSLWLHGSLEILGGPTPFYSLLTPAFVGWPLAAFGLRTGLDIVQGLQALVMSLAAVPVFLWGRRLVSPRWALVAAVLAVAVPGLTYSGLLMSEVLFYPLLVCAAWAGAAAIARPTRQTQALLVAAVLAVCATRVQAIVLLPALATAAVLDAWLARSWSRLRGLMPAAGALGALVVAWLAYRLASGGGALGSYEVIATTSWSVGAAAKYVVYHAASLLILCGLFPAAAVALLLVRAVRGGEPDPEARAYVAVASSLTVWLVVEVGVFTSHYSDRIVERNLIGLAPVLFVGLVLWLSRGAPGTLAERAAVALVAVVVLVVLPIDRYVDITGMHDAMTLVPLYKLANLTSGGAMRGIYIGVACIAVAALVLAPRGWLRWVPLVLAIAFAGASVASSRFAVQQARAQQRTFLGKHPAWVDSRTETPVAYLYDGEPSWNGVWQTVFWNHRIDRIYDIGREPVPGPLPQAPGEVQPDGTLFLPPSARQPGEWAVVSTWTTMVGEARKEIKQVGLTQKGLRLWHVTPPMRVLDRISGLAVNGDVNAQDHARLDAYGCREGVFRVTLIVKQPESISIFVNGKLGRQLEFPSPKPQESWHGEFGVQGHPGDLCSLEVVPTGLMGTTIFEFDRSS
jgi:hypothetical protein